MKAGIELAAKFKNVFNNIFKNKSICILGVDGTGKTSLTTALKEYFGQSADIQYMGLHSCETSYARSRYNTENHRYEFLSVLKNFAALYLEMWYRIVCHWPTRKIIIYDRYSWEIMLKYKGVKRTITKLFLKTLFPKPKYVFYLYCPVEISLSRKNDIESIVEFRDTKKEYDLNFMHSKKIISIDTGSTDLAALMEQILKALPEDLMINFRA